MTPEQQQIRRVVCAACRKGDVLIIGARHFDGMMRRQLDAMGRASLPGCEQGFIDQFGNFMTREEAWQLAWTTSSTVRTSTNCGGRQRHEDSCPTNGEQR